METTLLKADSLVPYKKHKFRPYDEARLADMMESIQENGILAPVIVRPLAKKPGKYEILCGHNRVNAACQLGWVDIPSVIKHKLPDDEAAFIVAESNLMQRSFADMGMSERAFVIKDYMEALASINKKGRKKKNLLENVKLCGTVNLSQLETKLRPDWAKNLASDKYALSPATIHRYLRIAELPEALLNRLDLGEIGFIPAVELSYMDPEELNCIAQLIKEGNGFRVSLQKAKTLREESVSTKDALTAEDISAIVAGAHAGLPSVIRLHPQAIATLAHFSIDDPDVINGIIIHYLSLLRAGKIEDKLNLLPNVSEASGGDTP